MAPQPHTNFDAKGIISLDGKELHIFDSEGECRVFVFKYPSDLRMGDLCFNPHNIPGDMLTACLDPETGLHVDEDDVEPGPSGETLPHLHAHRRSHNPCCSKNVQKEMLAKEGLLVLKDDGDDGVLDAPLNENFPEACNADLMDKNQPNHDEFHGTRIKIKHGDHFDELVVHPTEGKSTLLMRTEKDCESGNHRHKDYHGVLKAVQERKFGLDDTDEDCNDPGAKCGGSGRLVFCEHTQLKLIIYEFEQSRKFRVIDYFPNWLKQIDINTQSPRRVQAALKMAAAEKTVGKSTFFVQHICCASEIPPLRKIIEPIDGVSNVSFNVTNKLVYVQHDFMVTSATAIEEKINEAKFGASVKKDAGAKRASTADKVDADGNRKIEGGTNADESSRGAAAERPNVVEEVQIGSVKWNVKLAGILWAISMLGYLGGGGDVDIDIDGGRGGDGDTEGGFHFPSWLLNFKLFGAASFFMGVYQIAEKALATIKRGAIDANVLMFTAACGAMALGDFPEAAGLTFLFSLSEWLEAMATGKARKALATIVSLRPEMANKQIIDSKTGEVSVIMVAADEVEVGEKVLVKTGDKIPCDGEVSKGESVVDESSLTGESRPVKKSPGAKVYSGTINCGHSPLVVSVTETTENSAIAKLIDLVEEAQANRSPTEKLVDEFAKRYTPIVVLASLFMCTFPWLISKEAGRMWLGRGLVLIVVACPCALITSTPVTYVAGLAATAQKGIIVKGGLHLESLARVKMVACDKTGTLTHGNFALLELFLCGGGKKRKKGNWGDREFIFKVLAILERESSHPMAAALVKAAQNEGVTLQAEDTPENHNILKGEGVSGNLPGKFGGKLVNVGNERLMRRLGVWKSIDQADKERGSKWSSEGGTVGWISVDGIGVVAGFCVADKIRGGSKDTVTELEERMGVDVFMLTGDSEGAALAVGEAVGIKRENIKFGLLPENKLQIIEEMKQAGAGKILMCGDGVNDAPALSTADVSIAMGAAGSAIAIETADIAIMDSEIHKLAYCVFMGRRVLAVIKQNIIFSILTKGIVMVLIFMGHGSLWLAIISDVGSMLAVTLNGMKLLPRANEKHELAAAQGEGEGEEDGVTEATHLLHSNVDYGGRD